ncbi:MAG: hypothetical protein DSM106950_03365 [Stigonema ocellatum SAG 48.90 = DSM 106950]|nr:hypothetical protein [Stigonema ocellatum SAG 48.90 = DSM 106950]
MNLKIRRRRFGQLAFASAATAAITNLAGKVVAQSQPILFSVGVSTSNFIADDVPSLTPQLTLTSSNVITGQQISNSEILPTTVHNIGTPIETVIKSIFTEPEEVITGFDSLFNGTLVKTSVLRSNDGNVTRLIFTDPQSSQTINTLIVSGFSTDNSTVESLLVTPENNFIGIISLNEGTPPFDLATIDGTTGKVTSSTASGLPQLEPDKRYGNLAQAPDATIYATTLGREGATTLVRVNLSDNSINPVVQLSFNDQSLSNDLLSLTVSSSGQVYALANPNHEAINSLFTVDVNTGVLTFVRQLDAEQITFPRS